MDRTVEIRKKSVWPIYGIGLTWLVGALIFPIYKLSGLLIVAGLSMIVFAVMLKLCPDEVRLVKMDVTTGDASADEIMEAIHANREKLRVINDRIPDDELSAMISRMENACDGIVSQLQKEPAQAKELRRFTTHYLPDAVKILDLYAEMEEKGVTGNYSADVRKEVEQNAGIIATAFENQLDGLYATRALDISTDMDVLEGMLKGQGLV